MSIKEKIKQNKWDILILLIYAIITFIVTVIFHEKWRDEAQAWLIARDLNFWGIIKQMSYEGHPPLWYFIIAPFAKIGLPYQTQGIVSWLIMVFTAWLILKKSPFKKYMQIFIILTAPFIYLYPAISRSYCLIPLALTLIAIYYPERKEKQIQYSLSILFLAYTHVIMLGMVGILYLLFFVEQVFFTKKSKKDIKNLTIALIFTVIGILFLAFMLLGSTNKNGYVSVNPINSFKLIGLKILLSGIELQIFGTLAKRIIFKILFWAWFILLTGIGIKKNPKNTVIFFISILWQLLIYLFIYGCSQQRSNTMLLIAIFIIWICISDKNEIKNKVLKQIVTIGAILLLTLNITVGIDEMVKDFIMPYSSAEETAKYIEENTEENAIFVCTDGPIPSAIIPYVKNKLFWNPSSEEYFTFVTLSDKSIINMSGEEIVEKIKEKFTDKSKVYIIDNQGKIKDESLKVIYKSREDLIRLDEKYIIYEMNL